ESPARAGKPPEGAVELAAVDPRQVFHDHVRAAVVEKLGPSAVTQTELPKMVGALADLFGADVIDGVMKESVAGLSAGAGAADFLDAFFGHIEAEAKAAQGADGVRAAKLLKAQALASLLKGAEAPPGGAARPEGGAGGSERALSQANAAQIKRSLTTVIDDLALEAGGKADYARRIGNSSAELGHLAEIVDLYNLPGAPERNLQPLLRDIEAAEDRLLNRGPVGAPNETAQGAASTATALEDTLRKLPEDAPRELQQALLGRIADSYKLLGKAAGQLAGKESGERAAALTNVVSEANLRESRALLAAGQPDEALAVLRGMAKTPEHAAALAATLAQAEATWESLTPEQRHRIGDLESIEKEKIKALGDWLETAQAPHEIGAAGLALAGEFDKAGDAAAATAAIEKALSRSPNDPVLAGALLSRRVAAGGEITKQSLADALKDIPEGLRGAALAVTFSDLGAAGSLKSLDAIAAAAAEVKGLTDDQRARLGLQLDLARIGAIDKEPLGAERDRHLAEVVTSAKEKLGALAGLDPEVRQSISDSLDAVDKSQQKIVEWQNALAGNGEGGFSLMAREAMQAGRLDIAGAALIRHLKELDVTGDRPESLRRIGEVGTILKMQRGLLADQSLSPEQRTAVQSFVDKVSAELDARIDREIADQQKNYDTLAARAAEQRQGGEASQAALDNSARAVASALSSLRLLSHLRIDAQISALPEDQRRNFLDDELAKATANAAKLQEAIPGLFSGEKANVETGDTRLRVEKFLAELNGLRAQRDGIQDYIVDHTGPSGGELSTAAVNGGLMQHEATLSARNWALRAVELDLDGFSDWDKPFDNDVQAQKHGARPRRVNLESQRPSLYNEGTLDKEVWIKILVARNEESYLERRATELVREDRSLTAQQQDTALENRIDHEVKQYKAWGEVSPLLLPELTGIRADVRRTAEERYVYIQDLRSSNLERDLEQARASNDPQKGFEALVKLREAYLAGEIDHYVDYLNTDWHKRGPVYLKRVMTDRAETQNELEAVTVDAAHLHALLVVAAYNAVEKLSPDDRAYLEDRGFIVNGQYKLPADFKIAATAVGSKFSEKSLIDEYINAGTAAELLVTVAVPGALSARIAEGTFGRVAFKELVAAGVSREGAALLARYAGQKAFEAALFTGFSRGARTALHPAEMLQGNLWTFGALGQEYLHNLAVIGALNIVGGATGGALKGLESGLGKSVESGAGKVLFQNAAEVTSLGVEAGALTGLDSALSGNTITQKHFLGNALTVFMLRGIHFVGETVSPSGEPGQVGQTALAQEAYNRWLDGELAKTAQEPGALPESAARQYQEDPAAELMRMRFGGSWEAARKVFKNGGITEAEMKGLFDYRKKVVDALAQEIVSELGGDVKAFGSEKLTSDYDLSFEGPMAEVAVILFNARWTARWGEALGIGGRESAFAADTNVYTKPIYDMFPGMRSDVLAQDGFAQLAIRKYMTDADWSAHRERMLDGASSPAVRARLTEMLDWAEATHATLEKSIKAKEEELSLQVHTGPGRPGVDVDAAARNRLYEEALKNLIHLKDKYAAEPNEAVRRQIAQELRDAQAMALYLASEAYQTNAAITHVVVNTQAAKRAITAASLLGETPSELKVPMTPEEGRQSFFEQLANTFKEFNHAEGFDTRPASDFNGLAGKIAKYFVRALDGARIGKLDLAKHRDLIEATVAIEAKRDKIGELGQLLDTLYPKDGAKDYLRAVRQALGEMTDAFAARFEIPQPEVAQSAGRVRELRAEAGGASA
ncbi:MAG: hypothetical protein WCF16_07905, partial [Alphaproteobacteria bacterium]